MTFSPTFDLVRQLDYKAQWYRCELIKIDRYFRCSKLCSNRGHVVEKSPLNIVLNVIVTMLGI